MRDVTFSRVPAGLRRSHHRLWLAVLGVVLAVAAAITAIIKFEAPSHGGPVHAVQTPARIGSFTRATGLQGVTDLAGSRTGVMQMGAGQASNVKSAVYESGNQMIIFTGGHLASTSPATSITSFTQKFAGATVVSAGSLGGKAACAEEGATTQSPVSMCVWFDNDSFGDMISPTMNATTLATVMRTVRPDLEIVVKN
jgi:hypothetical protein